ncbi:MAG TPA: CHASE2 domain-containing protein [Steroidobacteraceae bacterium]|jgi:CHASE2 domain-containing sensor protein
MASLRDKGVRHWAVALVILLLGFAAQRFIQSLPVVQVWKARLSQELLQLHFRPIQPRYVELVLIGDEEYWHGELAGRTPTKRDYLARLVDRLVAADAQTIALDFDMRLPDPARLEEFPEYRAETDRLARSILAAAAGRKIVLSKTIRRNGDAYKLEPDIYQLYGICSSLNPDGSWVHSGTASFIIDKNAAENISCGYIALTRDKRMLPLRLTLDDGRKLDSFSLAIARSRNPDEAHRLGDEIRYGSYMPTRKFVQFRRIHTAADLLRVDPATKRAVDGATVIVGADHSTVAYARGRADLHDTPIGPMNGALIHANFAEAYLDSRTYGHVPAKVVTVVEILFVAGGAVLFALLPGRWMVGAALVGMTVLLVLVQWIVLHLSGLSFDAMVPLIGVWLHAVAERLLS